MNEVDFERLPPDEAVKYLKTTKARAELLGSEKSRLEFNDCLDVVQKAEQARKERLVRATPPSKRFNPYGQKRKK